jgi:hypothetical protein
MDSDEANEENRIRGGNTLLYVFSRGSVALPSNLSYSLNLLDQKAQGHLI